MVGRARRVSRLGGKLHHQPRSHRLRRDEGPRHIYGDDGRRHRDHGRVRRAADSIHVEGPTERGDRHRSASEHRQHLAAIRAGLSHPGRPLVPVLGAALFLGQGGPPDGIPAFLRTAFAYFAPVDLTERMTRLAQQAKAASRELGRLTTAEKNAALLAMADALERNVPAIIDANAEDMEAGAKAHLASAMLDRLRLDEKRVAAMAKGLRDVATLPDPVGRVLDERVRPNGLKLQKVAVPIGVVVIIYESRPNVTADAASLDR